MCWLLQPWGMGVCGDNAAAPTDDGKENCINNCSGSREVLTWGLRWAKISLSRISMMLGHDVEGRWRSYWGDKVTGKRQDVFHSTGSFSWLRLRLKRCVRFPTQLDSWDTQVLIPYIKCYEGFYAIHNVYLMYSSAYYWLHMRNNSITNGTIQNKFSLTENKLSVLCGVWCRCIGLWMKWLRHEWTDKTSHVFVQGKRYWYHCVDWQHKSILPHHLWQDLALLKFPFAY